MLLIFHCLPNYQNAGSVLVVVVVIIETVLVVVVVPERLCKHIGAKLVANAQLNARQTTRQWRRGS